MNRIYPLALVLVSLVAPAIVPPPADASDAIQLAQRRRRALSWRVGVRPARSRVGAFSRSGNCPNQAKVTAFVPPPRAEEKVAQSSSTVDTTLSAYPTIWVYLASMPRTAQVEFTLQDAPGKKQLYSTRFPVTGRAGILGVRLPKTVPALQVGQTYLWQMAVRCDRDAADSDFVIGSWLQRLTPAQIQPTAGFDPKPLVQELARASDRDKPALYAGLGVWQDAVTSLIELRQQRPNDAELRDDWRNLLTGAQMAEFVNAPLLGVK